MGGTLLVASPGGHIDELVEFLQRIPAAGTDHTWVTARTPQTESLLKGEETIWVPAVASRQGGRALASLPQALRVIHHRKPDLVLSTGAALAAPYLLAARTRRRARIHYLESATRLNGPSMTGRMMATVPGVQLHHQGFRTAHRRWTRVGSVFDGYAPGSVTARPVRRIVVTLGTERYPFTRALDLVADALGPDVTALVQTGHTPVDGRSTACQPWVPFEELTRAVAEADVVVSHAGVGSILSALRAGKHPVVIPRTAALGEHVDDHQLGLAQFLEERGLVTVVGAPEHLGVALAAAAGRSTVRAKATPIEL